MSNGTVGMSADLIADHLRTTEVHKARSIKTPWGRMILTRDKGESVFLSQDKFQTNLTARKFDGDGILADEYNLGSGLVTNCGVLGMAYDWQWASPSASPQATLAKMNFHGVGTGVTAAAATDVQLQTPTTTNYTGSPSYQTGTQSTVSAANSQTYKTINTIAFTGTVAVTEWGLFNSATNTVAGTGTPFTASTATSATVTATPLTASSTSVVGTHQSLQIRPTTTNTVYGLAVSNTTSVITVPAWYSITAGTVGSTPGATEAFTVVPNMWDHKVFTAINVVNGDSIQFTYSLLINSGG
jgi:hypothetical protein